MATTAVAEPGRDPGSRLTSRLSARWQARLNLGRITVPAMGDQINLERRLSLLLRLVLGGKMAAAKVAGPDGFDVQDLSVIASDFTHIEPFRGLKGKLEGKDSARVTRLLARALGEWLPEDPDELPAGLPLRPEDLAFALRYCGNVADGRHEPLEALTVTPLEGFGGETWSPKTEASRKWRPKIASALSEYLLEQVQLDERSDTGGSEMLAGFPDRSTDAESELSTPRFDPDSDETTRDALNTLGLRVVEGILGQLYPSATFIQYRALSPGLSGASVFLVFPTAPQPSARVSQRSAGQRTFAPRSRTGGSTSRSSSPTSGSRPSSRPPSSATSVVSPTTSPARRL